MLLRFESLLVVIDGKPVPRTNILTNITAKHPAEALSYARTAYLATSSYDLGASPALPQHSFECDFPLCNTMPGTPDANLGDIIPDFLTNTQYGMGFSSSDIDAADLALFKSYQQAQGLFFSPILNSQEAGNSIIDRWALLANSWIFWSGDRLRLVPLGDVPLSAHSATYTPDLTIQYDLSVENGSFLDKDNPITVNRVDPADAYNRTIIQINDRAQDYNSNPVPFQDDDLVAQYGLRDNTNNSNGEICDAQVGLTCATLIGQRAAYMRNAYKWRTNYRFVRLEPGDLVTITDPNDASITKLPVRITSVDEDADYNLSFQAEEFPGTIGSVGNATPFPLSPTSFNQLVDPGDVNPPCIFEPDSTLSNGHAQVWLAASGGPFWGGADVFISFNSGSTYSPIGHITGKARQGVLTAILANHADPDTVDTLSVDLTVSDGILDPVTHADADAFRTLCLLAPTASSNGELVAYGAVSTTGSFTDDLTYLRRALYNTAATSHAVGAQFTLLDLTGQEGSLLQYDIPTQYLGTTILVKFVSRNIYGLAPQDISLVTAYSYTTVGTGYGGGTGGVPKQPTGVTTIGGAQDVEIAWNPNLATDNVTVYEIYAAPGTSVPFGSTVLIATEAAYDKVISGLGVSTAYSFYVVAVNAAGQSVPSAVSNVTTTSTIVGGPMIWAPTVSLFGRKPLSSEVILQTPITFATSLPIGFTGSKGDCVTAPTGNVDIDVQKTGVSVGTIRFPAGLSGDNVATFTSASGAAFPIGNDLKLIMPVSVDATFQDFSVQLRGSVT